MQTAKLHASRKCNCINYETTCVDSVQFFNSTILAKYSTVILTRRSVDYPLSLSTLRTKC